VELRTKLTSSFGLVAFSDMGLVEESVLPQFQQPWRFSVGGGLRIFTSFGPLRLDIGFPLNKRIGLDHNFQVYASIGQAF
jgi:translocation and assembly module TamA